MGVDEGDIQVMDRCKTDNGKLSNNYSYGTYLQVTTMVNIIQKYETPVFI